MDLQTLAHLMLQKWKLLPREDVASDWVSAFAEENVWCGVFEMLQPTFHPIRPEYGDEREFAGSREVRAHANHQQLRYVCKAFHRIFSTRIDLEQNVVLYHDTKLPGHVKGWQQYDSHIADFTLYVSEHQTEDVLYDIPAVLNRTSLGNVTVRSVLHLSVFTTLTECHLHQPVVEAVGLEPLTSLVNLQLLSLQKGTFTNVPPCSPKLILTDAKAICEFGFCVAEGLQCLKVDSVSRFLLHNGRPGLAVCNSLTELHMVDPGIFDPDTGFLAAYQHLPSGIHQLWHLTKLVLSVANSKVDLAAFPAGLEDLELHVFQTTVTGNGSHLSRLWRFAVNATPRRAGHGREPAPSRVKFAVNWLDFKALQCLVLSGPVALDKILWCLELLPHLAHFDCLHVEVCGSLTKETLDELQVKLHNRDHPDHPIGNGKYLRPPKRLTRMA